MGQMTAMQTGLQCRRFEKELYVCVVSLQLGEFIFAYKDDYIERVWMGEVGLNNSVYMFYKPNDENRQHKLDGESVQGLYIYLYTS